MTMSLAEPRMPVEEHPYAPPQDVRRVLLIARDGAHLPELHMAGDQDLLSRRAVAVVGSRDASSAGLDSAWEVASALAEAGIVVVSGLAQGIDAAAHRAAMQAGGRTIAVIGTSLDRAYPRRHARLQEDIYQRHLLVSPFARGTETARSHFPERNRIMARLSDATVLVEAGERSGTVHQVREALSCRRRVFVAEALLRGSVVAWVRKLGQHPGVVVWSTPNDVVAHCARTPRA
jgi:DNA processing protein